MKRICKFCEKEYDWEEGQLNWGKNGLKKGKGSIRSDLFCCYDCGIKYRLNNMQKTCLERYGVSNFYKSEKVKHIILEKYGVINPFQSEKCKEKIKQTNLKRYGVENPGQSKEIRKKREQTCLEKYGAKICYQSKELKEKSKQICIEKYGVDNPAKSNKIKEKTKQNNIKKYGVIHPTQLKSTQEKMQKTCLEKYGVDNYSKTEEFKSKFKNKEWINNIQRKIYNIKKLHNSFNTSKLEEEIYQLLLQKFPQVERQYKSKLYPFSCDFYIKSLDLYIEFQGNWTHGKEPYNENNKEHLELVENWKKKSEEINFKQKRKNQYLSAINIWTISDPLKRKTARENNLNWIEFFNLEEFYKWYNI